MHFFVFLCVLTVDLYQQLLFCCYRIQVSDIVLSLSVLRDVRQRRLTGRCQRFGETCSLRLQTWGWINIYVLRNVGICKSTQRHNSCTLVQLVSWITIKPETCEKLISVPKLPSWCLPDIMCDFHLLWTGYGNKVMGCRNLALYILRVLEWLLACPCRYQPRDMSVETGLLSSPYAVMSTISTPV